METMTINIRGGCSRFIENRAKVIRTIVVFIVWGFFHLGCQSAWAGDNVLQLSITGKSYEKLQLKIRMVYSNEFIQGNDLGNNLWEFHIPDSVYERGQGMKLTVPSNDSIFHELMFYTLPQNDLYISDFYIKKQHSKLNLRYAESDTLKKVSFYMNKDAIWDSFLVSTDDLEFEANMKRIFMSREFRNNSYSKAERMGKFISLVKEYPDSHLLISYLYSILKGLNSKDDIKNIVNHFSEQARESYYGQLIHTYLYPKEFPNMQLQVLGKASKEPVIVNREKDYLVIFTASWCQPCHKLIPVLKELYDELKDKVEFTYISIDDSRTIDNWPEVVEKNEIPWRCLNAADQVDEVMKTYTIQGIPSAYHVTKDGGFKGINLQNAQERNKLIQELKP